MVNTNGINWNGTSSLKSVGRVVCRKFSRKKMRLNMLDNRLCVAKRNHNTYTKMSIIVT
uniref:Uncharacterized protein n=1 Tax=Anguilla anguilla TaxID=7936 RepID=A0A0E9VWT9_ANGAN